MKLRCHWNFLRPKHNISYFLCDCLLQYLTYQVSWDVLDLLSTIVIYILMLLRIYIDPEKESDHGFTQIVDIVAQQWGLI